MPLDWVARLDARGYHALPVAREDNVVSWNGSTRVEDGVVVGDAITVADPIDHTQQRTLHVGGFIFMHIVSPPPPVVTITRMPRRRSEGLEACKAHVLCTKANRSHEL